MDGINLFAAVEAIPMKLRVKLMVGYRPYIRMGVADRRPSAERGDHSILH
jgi:hypothetical protein